MRVYKVQSKRVSRRQAYETRTTHDTYILALEWYHMINIGPGYMKRMVCIEDHFKPVTLWTGNENGNHQHKPNFKGK